MHSTLKFAAETVIIGAVLSCTAIVCDAVATFPHPSVAVHVRITVYDPAQVPCVVTSCEVSVKAEPQASIAVAIAKAGTAGHEIVEGAGRAAITGAVTSVTLIVCESVEALPQASVAVHILVIEYEPAQAPLVVVSTYVKTGKLSQLSIAFAASNTGVSGQFTEYVGGNGSKTGAVVS